MTGCAAPAARGTAQGNQSQPDQDGGHREHDRAARNEYHRDPFYQGALSLDLCLMIEGQEGVTWPQWRALAEACERHRISTLFRSDHLQNLDGQHPDRARLTAWGTTTALPALPTKLRFGTLVTPTSFRHPSVLAKLVVTADHVSDGRIDLGIGAGWHEREHEAYGYPFLKASERIDVLKEQLEILVGHWGEEEFSF